MEFRSQPTTHCESDHTWVSSSANGNSFFRNLTIRVPIRTASNSSRGTVAALIRQSLDFLYKTWTEAASSPSDVRRYAAAPYAPFDASQKTCSSLRTADVLFAPT